MLERRSRRSPDRAALEQIVEEMMGGVTFSLRTYIRMCNALLSGSGMISAVALQEACDAAAFGASATCGATMTMMMKG